MGNALNSSDVNRQYPDGPPSCTQCSPGKLPTADGGFIGLPSNESCEAYFGPQGCTPAVAGFDSALMIVLYAVWAVTILAAAGWACYRSSLFMGGSRRDSRGKKIVVVGASIKRDSNSDDHVVFDEESQSLLARGSGVGIGESWGVDNDEGPRSMTIEYLRHSKAESVASILLVVNGLTLLIYYLLLTFDFYLECQNVIGSVDNACFFGTFRLFGNYENNAEVFLVVWIALVVYSVFLAFFYKDIYDWVSAPATEETATKVRVWVEDEVHILTSGRLSWGTRFKRSVEAFTRKWRSKIYRAITGEPSTPAGWTGRYATVPILTTPLGRRYFIFETVRYAVPGGARIKLTLEDAKIGTIRGLRASNGLDPENWKHTWDRCGPNVIPLELPTLGALLVDEFMTPFYAYQLTIYCIWIWWTYWFVGLWLLLIVVFSGLWSVWLKRKNLKDVYALAEHHDGVRVMKDQKEWRFFPDAGGLVCGDVVKVSIEKGKREWVVPADLVLVEGSCAVDESGLTGESMPRSKTAVSASLRDAEQVISSADPRYKSHVLFAGTKVIEASEDAVAVVLAVGTDATRGQLLSHVLFPVKTLFRFDEEFAVAVFMMLIYALIAFSIAIAFQVSNGSASTWPTILAYGIMTVSQIVSPMLKIALVAGRVAATRRLKKKGIACLDTGRIDIAGKVKLFCFDKTGTLTKDGLSFMGFKPVSSSSSSRTLGGLQPEFQSSKSEACKCAASCHSLAFYDGRFLGSGVEAAMFKSTGWTLTSGDPDDACSPDATVRTHVKRRLQFDQERRMMSVVVQEESLVGATSTKALATMQPLTVYSKGAPESIAKRCSSGVPAGFIEEADALAAEGCYVLALASRQLQGWTMDKALSDANRDEIESDLTCLGLLVFKNELKSDAPYAIQELKNGHIRCVMITGDNAPCGCYIAKESGLIPHDRRVVLGYVEDDRVCWKTMFEKEETKWDSTSAMTKDLSELTELAVTGEAFDKLRFTGDIFDRNILFKIRVFARMSPSQKVLAVHAFMDGPEGVVCAMCGDGGNDSGALRAAHVGLSMSSAEASVVAPFNSAKESVFACVDLILEGRAALATSLASYKLLVIYGMLFSIVKMASFYYAVLMPLLGYVMIDIVAVVPLTFFMTLSKPLTHLGPKRPTSSLLEWQTVSSVVGFLFISVCSLTTNLLVMSSDPGYVRWPAGNADTAAWWFISDNYESTVIWISCYLLFISSALSFSFGSGFRSNVFSNYLLVLSWVALYLVGTLLILLPLNWLSVQFHIASEQFNRVGTTNPVWQQYQAKGGQPSPGMSFSLRLLIWGLSCIAVAIAMFWERFVVFGPAGRGIKRAWKKRFGRTYTEARTEFPSF